MNISSDEIVMNGSIRLLMVSSVKNVLNRFKGVSLQTDRLYHFVFAGLLVLSTLISNPAWAEVQIGKPAPAFTATDLDGVQLSLASLKGAYTVLEWSNPGCPFVKKHYYSGNLQRLQREFLAKGVKWIIVNSSAPGKQGHLSIEEAQEWMKEQGVSGVKMVLDSAGTVGRSFGAKTTPQLFVIDPQGVVIYAGAIDDDSSASQESVETAKNYVAAALNEELAGKPVAVPVTDPYGCSVKYGG